MQVHHTFILRLLMLLLFALNLFAALSYSVLLACSTNSALKRLREKSLLYIFHIFRWQFFCCFTLPTWKNAWYLADPAPSWLNFSLCMYAAMLSMILSHIFIVVVALLLVVVLVIKKLLFCLRSHSVLCSFICGKSYGKVFLFAFNSCWKLSELMHFQADCSSFLLFVNIFFNIKCLWICLNFEKLKSCTEL